MHVEIYLAKKLIATLTLEIAGRAWTLKSKAYHVDETPEVEAAIQRAMHDATTDVFQPNGRSVQLNEVEYVATRLVQI